MQIQDQYLSLKKTSGLEKDFSHCRFIESGACIRTGPFFIEKFIHDYGILIIHHGRNVISPYHKWLNVIFGNDESSKRRNR